MNRKFLPALFLCALVPAVILSPPVRAETNTVREQWLAQYRHLGLAAALTYPFQDFGEDYDTGYGLHAMFDYPLIPLLNVTGSAGWNHFPRIEEGESLDVLNLAAGGKIALGVFYIGGEVGYFSEVEEWSWVPSMGVRLGSNWDFAVRLKATGSGSWTTLRAGCYFF